LYAKLHRDGRRRRWSGSSGYGVTLGVAQVPRVGEVHKDYLKSRPGALAPASVEIVDMALRVALAL
jgi:hypothetical protein